MNRVYKVIWSKAKHCYVVTSEIARSVTKSASSARSAGRKGAAVLAMAALLFTAGGVLGEAANVTDVTAGSTADVIMVTKDDGTTTSITINDVYHAMKANSDGDGLIIKENYVKNADARVSTDGEYVKKDKKVGENLSALDEQVKTVEVAVNEVVTTVGELGEKVTGLDGEVKAEAVARKEADKDNLKVGDDGVISKVTGDDGTTSSAVNKLVLNKDGKNQITLSEDGIKVGLNSGVMDKDGFYAGGDDYEHAGAALKWDGSIKGAAGDFTVDTKGKVTAASGKIGTVEITSAGAVSGVTDLTVNGTFDSKTLSSTVDAKDDYTTINGGNVTSEVNDKVGTVDYSAESIFNKDGSSITVRTDEGIVDSTGKSIVGAKEISQYLGDNAKPEGSQKNVTRKMIRNNDGTFSMEDKAVDGTNKYSTVSQNAGERKVTVIDGNNKASTNLSNNGFNTFASDGTNKTYTKQTATDIKNTAEKGMISHTAKNLVNRAYENMTNTVDNDLTTTVGGNETHAVTGNQTVTVSKDRTVNVKGTETENFNAQVTNVKTDQKTSVGGNQTNIVTGNQQNTVSGSKTETVNKAVTEKYGSQATTVNGDQSTNVGGNQSNVVKGNQTNTISGSKTESVKGAVTETYGSQSTTVNGNQSNTVKGTLTETVTGNVTEDYKANLDTTVGGNETRTVEGTLTETVTGDVTEDYKANLDTNVTGDSSLKAKNIHNTANEALTNDANTITNKAHESVTTQIGEGTAVKSVMDVKGIANTATGRAITNDAATITNTGIASVTNQVGDNKVLVETNQVKSAFGDTIYTTWDADGITNDAADKAVKTFTGNNTVISDNDGTTFENTAHSTAFKGGTVTKTTISGNTITTGKAVMDYANVTKDLSVGGDLNVDGNIETHDAVLSADSRQVVTGRQLYQTNERVDRLDNRIKKVGANAAALAALRPGDFNPDDKFSIAAGFGSYRNANAAALGLFYRPNENVLLSLGTSFGDGENMVNAGVSVKFGRGKSMAERRKEMADEVSSMRDEMRSQDERIAELEEMLKKQSELIEKLSKES